MNLLNNKKSEILTISIIVVLIVLSIIVLGEWFANFNAKECRSDSQCPSDNYCGSDFSCHPVPTIEKTIIENNLVIPSIIIGIAIVIAAMILKSGKIFTRKNEHQETVPEETEKNTLKLP